MNTASRAYRILADPPSEWTKIAAESGDAAYLLTRYVARLALIPAVFGLIGACAVGVAKPGGIVVRAPVFDGLFGAIFGYVMSCAIVLVLGLLIDSLAPLFGGKRSFENAFKLAVYSFTPVWLVGMFLLAPGLRFLCLLATYGIYLLWTGLPPMMQTRPANALTYTAVIAVCAGILIAGIAAAQHVLFGLHF